MAGMMYLPPPPNPWAQSMNQVGTLLQNLALAKIAQNFREKEAQMEFERKKVLLEEAKAEAKTEKEEERKFQVELAGGVPVEPRLTPMGMVAPSEVVDPETGLPEKTIRIGQQSYRIPGKRPVLYTHEGKEYQWTGTKLEPLEGEGKVPSALLQFELRTYGKPVPELRGTGEYQRAELAYTRAQKEASPYIDQLARQNQVVLQKMGSDLRKEFTGLPEVKEFSDVQRKMAIMDEAMKESKTSKNLVAVDQALITLYNKLTDPQSVVRESEYARTAQDLALLNRLKGKMEKVVSGGAGLTDDDREAIRRMASKFYGVSREKYKTRIHEYRGYAAGYGLSPDSVIADSILPAKGETTKKVIRTGTYKGKRVVEYDDGTVDYAD